MAETEHFIWLLYPGSRCKWKLQLNKIKQKGRKTTLALKTSGGGAVGAVYGGGSRNLGTLLGLWKCWLYQLSEGWYPKHFLLLVPCTKNQNSLIWTMTTIFSPWQTTQCWQCSRKHYQNYSATNSKVMHSVILNHSELMTKLSSLLVPFTYPTRQVVTNVSELEHYVYIYHNGLLCTLKAKAS